MDEFQDNYAELKKVHKKGYMPSDSIYTKSQKSQTNLEGQKADQTGPGGDYQGAQRSFLG